MKYINAIKSSKVQRFLMAIMLVVNACIIFGQKNAQAADVADFALGEHNICIVTTEGVLECTTNEAVGLYLPPDTDSRYIAVASGGAHSCAITDTGDITCWGANNFGQLDAPVAVSPFVSISASEGHTCALDTNGQVSCWGLNSNGQTDVPEDNSDFVKLYTGTNGSCGTKTSGITVCWSDTWPYDRIDGEEGIIDLHVMQREGEGAVWVNEQGVLRYFLSYGSVARLDDGPYTRVRSNGVMLCGLKTNGDMDCNLRNRDFANTSINRALLASIEALPPLADFDTHYEYDYHMSFCGVDLDRQLHCFGDALPADRLPGEEGDLPVATNLSLSVYGENVAELLWNVDLSGIGGAPGQFRVYRNGEVVSQAFANASYLDRDFEIGVPYVYEVSYIAPDGMEGPLSEPLAVNGAFSNPGTDSVIGTPNDDTVLSGIEVSRYGEDSLEIFWDRPSSSIRQYDIYRNGELVASVPGPSYFDNQINATNAYQYTIVAISNNGSIQANGFTRVESFSGLQCF